MLGQLNSEALCSSCKCPIARLESGVAMPWIIMKLRIPLLVSGMVVSASRQDPHCDGPASHGQCQPGLIGNQLDCVRDLFATG